LRRQGGVGHATDPDLVVARRGDALQDVVDDLADGQAPGAITGKQVVDAEVGGHWRFVGIVLAIAPFFRRGANVADDKPDIARWVDEGAKAIGLPIAPEYREKVILNVERSLAIAQPLLELELDDALTPLPAYRP
jgi:hypothetical protein